MVVTVLEEAERRSATQRWDTPRKLQTAGALLVSLSLLCAIGGISDARTRANATRKIAEQTEPLIADIVEVYRALADADATVAVEFLPGADTGAARARYDDDVARATASLVRVGDYVGIEGLAGDRVTDIAAHVPIYTGMVEQARANNRPGSSGAAEVRGASELMRKTILRRTESLLRSESERLGDQYDRAGSAPGLPLALAGVMLAALVGAQLFLLRATRRILNPGLLAATAAVLVAAGWWTVAIRVSQQHLAESERHSRSVADALAQAQIAARQARASELLGLLATDAAPYEEDFSAKTQRIARSHGAGGALGAARKLVAHPTATAQVSAAVAGTGVWVRAHEDLRTLQTRDRDQAMAMAVDVRRAGTARAFAELDTTLSEAVAVERAGFTAAMGRSQQDLDGLVRITLLAAVVVLVGSVVGLAPRLAEYR